MKHIIPMVGLKEGKNKDNTAYWEMCADRRYR